MDPVFILFEKYPWMLVVSIIMILSSIVVQFVMICREDSCDCNISDNVEKEAKVEIVPSERTIKKRFKCSNCCAEYVLDLDSRFAEMYNIIGTVECDYCGKIYDLKDVLNNKKNKSMR